MSTNTIQQDIIYSDILPDFEVHPVTEDLVRAINEAAVKRSIRSLILTNKGERLFQPDIGSNVRQFLFENMTPQTQQDIQDDIIQCIQNYEPRCNLISVVVSPNYNQEYYAITITFSIINSVDPTTLNLSLERIR